MAICNLVEFSRWRAIATFLALASISFIAVDTASAQDAQPWNYQFGPRGSLMGGAMVGGVRDTSATFYNPGALGFVHNPSLSVSANLYRYEEVSLDNGAGTGSDLSSDEVLIVPSLIAGVLDIDASERHTIAWSVLARNRTKITDSARVDDQRDVLLNEFNPGLEDFTGQYTFDKDLYEYWAGLSYGYKVNDWLALGLSNFLALRNEKFSEQAYARAVNEDAFNNPIFTNAGTNQFLSYDITTLNLLWKGGVAFEFDALKFGVTATSPGVNLYGSGTVNGDLSVFNLDFNRTGLPSSFVANDRQSSLDADYRTPASLAAGVEYNFEDSGTLLAASTEWFGGQGQYSMVKPRSKEFVRPTGAVPGLDSAEFFRVLDSGDAVLNVAVGVEQKLTEKFSLIGSFRTDFETHQEIQDAGMQRALSSWDLYHFTLGGIYKRERSDVSFGIEYSFGDTDNRTQAVNFAGASEETLLLGEPGPAGVDYFSVALILGYTYHFD